MLEICDCDLKALSDGKGPARVRMANEMHLERGKESASEIKCFLWTLHWPHLIPWAGLIVYGTLHTSEDRIRVSSGGTVFISVIVPPPLFNSKQSYSCAMRPAFLNFPCRKMWQQHELAWVKVSPRQACASWDGREGQATTAFVLFFHLLTRLFLLLFSH